MAATQSDRHGEPALCNWPEDALAVAPRAGSPTCFHCGLPCSDPSLLKNEKAFCCHGCQAVFELLTESGLANFYQLSPNPGVRVETQPADHHLSYLDEPGVRERLVNFTNDQITRVTFHIPAIHCVACIWLLENLFRLNPEIGASRVNFPRRELAVTFATSQIKLSQVVALLTSIGYEPVLKLSDLDRRSEKRPARELWLQLGLAGFAFGNIMLLSIAAYLGLDSWSGPRFEKLFGYLSLMLSIPVVVYSARGYWRAAWTSLRQRLLNIEVPIALGIIAIFAQSSYEVLSSTGSGYFDSLTGLLFFLLCGKLFQQKTFDAMAFDRDYRCFFPLSVCRLAPRMPPPTQPLQEFNPPSEERVALDQITPGDRLLIRNGELLPADARLHNGAATIDYSFVTGESEPVHKQPGDYLFAGGRQIGGSIEVHVLKPVSQSYLTSLWNQDAFSKPRTASRLDKLTNDYSQRFTKIVIALAVAAAFFWLTVDAQRALYAFTSVLIVACPCALALGAPFTFGTALRLLSRAHLFLKNSAVIETLSRIDAIVFDKTGTLTTPNTGISFIGPELSHQEKSWVYSVVHGSTHPHARRICEWLGRNRTALPLQAFRETIGAGIDGKVDGASVGLGSKSWLAHHGLSVPDHVSDHTSASHLVVNGQFRGSFLFAGELRSETATLIQRLSRRYPLALLSGDHERHRARFSRVFGSNAQLRFNQSPHDKLQFIQNLQQSGKTVMMVGDGLNDAGAFKQSDVGIAVVEDISTFSPASDAIIPAYSVSRLPALLQFAKESVAIVRASFVVSGLYNVIGIAIAAQGLLSPIVCAVLMPLSSLTVVSLVCGLTLWRGRQHGFANPGSSRSTRTTIEAQPRDKSLIIPNVSCTPRPFPLPALAQCEAGKSARGEGP